MAHREVALRVGIQGGCCSGLSCNIRFDSQPRDRTFTFGAGAETPNDPSGAKPVRILVDPKSFLYLAGMVLNFEETLMRRGFNFINPNSTKSCGCGCSFSASTVTLLRPCRARSHAQSQILLNK
jgi:iron-sulfur cluster assembly protein